LTCVYKRTDYRLETSALARKLALDCETLRSTASAAVPVAAAVPVVLVAAAMAAMAATVATSYHGNEKKNSPSPRRACFRFPPRFCLQF
jgi:hypothetical protein